MVVNSETPKRPVVKFIVIPIDSGQPFDIGLKGKANRRVLIAVEERKLSFMHCYDSFQGSHMKGDKTLQKTNSRYYWSGLYVDVLQWIAECAKYQKFEQIKTVAQQLIKDDKRQVDSGKWWELS